MLMFLSMSSFMAFLLNSFSFSTFLFQFLILITILFLLNNFWFMSNLIYMNHIIDSLGFFMLFMSLFLLVICFIFKFKNSSILDSFYIYLSIFFISWMVFTTKNMFLLYIFYELSLLPILFVIMVWGVYPDRSLSTIMLLMYTLVFSVPFLVILFMNYFISYSFFDTMMKNSSYNLIINLLTFFVFAVKLPIYGLHFWLPMAHVEAPTSGSMILAGILLKLGGVGLYRFFFMVGVGNITMVLLSYFLISTIIVTSICSFQSDFKRLIAYSSISHMMLIPLLILADNLLGMKSILMVMLFHGFSSPLMFMSVSILYEFYGTRQLLNLRGLLLVSPLFTMLMVLIFFYTLSIPPFPSFLGEVSSFISIFNLSFSIIPFLLFLVFLSLVYNLLWLVSIIFMKDNLQVYSSSLSFIYFITMGVSFLLLFMLFMIFSFF